MSAVPHTPFNGDQYIGVELRRLIAAHEIRSIVETGMWSAHSTREFRTMVSGRVTTLDITTEHLVEEFGSGAVEDLAALGIELVLGDSGETLAGMLAGYGDEDFPLLAYLDGHGPDCPIVEELDALATDWRCLDRVVLAIHDCIVPHKPWGYNTVEWPWSGGPQPLGYEVLKHKFPALYPSGYAYYYNEKAEGCQRGVLYVTPVLGNVT